MIVLRSLKNNILDNYIEELRKNNCKITKIINDPVYLNGTIRPICFLEFIYEGYIYLTLLEMDFKGCLSAFRINNTYEKLYKCRGVFKEFRDTFPIIVIAAEQKSIRYNSKNFEVVYTDFEFLNLKYLLF